ncbi:MAG: PPOX class F420-dependent oxidoreductase [Candidatus Rokubacteria bacterium]|nr:PPOX class F420-dependent oxidoreductase [Candidatus Rokubacteria bacterium]
MATIPDAFRPLLGDDVKAFANLATLLPDGSPQVTPVWFDAEGDVIRVNTAKGRWKDRNMRRDGRVALAIMDPANPYRYVQIRGRVERVAEDGADAHIDRLAKKYLGAATYPFRQPGEVRVIYVIRAERVTTMG